MKEERIFVLLGKKLSNEANEEELAELAGLLRDQSVPPHILELLHEIWRKQPRTVGVPLEAKWERIASRLAAAGSHQPEQDLPDEEKRRRFFPVSLAAAVVAILALTAWLAWFRPDHTPEATGPIVAQATVVTTPNGERKKITLPDGTRIHLNSGSKLTYTENFGRQDREVKLAGEAFFEVAKDPARPFLVNTNRMVVKVLGTVFNVKAYDTQEDIETTVVEGKVEVSLKDDKEKKVVLLPSEKISLRSNRLAVNSKEIPPPASIRYAVEAVKPVPRVQMPAETAWVNEKVVFDNEPFEIVALKMERWYNVHIHFENEKIKKILMTGDFHDEGIEEALNVLQIMVRFQYDMKGDHIYISAN